MLLLFYYLAPLQNDSLVMSLCVQFVFGDKREVRMLGKSALLLFQSQVTLVQPTNLSLVPKSELHA